MITTNQVAGREIVLTYLNTQEHQELPEKCHTVGHWFQITNRGIEINCADYSIVWKRKNMKIDAIEMEKKGEN